MVSTRPLERMFVGWLLLRELPLLVPIRSSPTRSAYLYYRYCSHGEVRRIARAGKLTVNQRLSFDPTDHNIESSKLTKLLKPLLLVHGWGESSITTNSKEVINFHCTTWLRLMLPVVIANTPVALVLILLQVLLAVIFHRSVYLDKEEIYS